MPRRENLNGWGISWERYRELAMFCLQYDQKRRDAAALLTLRISTPAPEIYKKAGKLYGVYMPHSTRISDPVAAAAEKRERLLQDIRMIEQAATAAAEGDATVSAAILRAVTSRGGVQALYANPEKRPPMGERQFKNVRRKFFWILSEMKDGNIEPMP